jgi:hypothetical protein
MINDAAADEHITKRRRTQVRMLANYPILYIIINFEQATSSGQALGDKSVSEVTKVSNKQDANVPQNVGPILLFLSREEAE